MMNLIDGELSEASIGFLNGQRLMSQSNASRVERGRER